MAKKILVAGITLTTALFLCVNPTNAMTEFKKAFGDTYVKPKKNEEFTELVRKAGCYVCHVKGQKEKTPQNPFGKELNKLIEGSAKERKAKAKEAGTSAEEKAKLLKELDAAFKKVEKMKSPSGEIYGDLLKNFKLPIPLPEKE